jgi:hypothetical protein
MRKSDAASGVASTAALAGKRDDQPLRLVCLALVLALVALALRIATIW